MWSGPASPRAVPVAAPSGVRPLEIKASSPPLPFVAITPCRVVDTRGNGFGGQYGPPALAGGAPRDFTLTGQCGVAGTAQAVSLNITVTNTLGPGFISVYPQGTAAPLVSTLNYGAGQTVANAAVVQLGTAGGITVIAGVSGADLIIDTNGYYAGSVVTSLNGLIADVTLAAGTDLTLTPSGQTLTLSVNSSSTSTPNTLVKRDSLGNFSAGAITAHLTGAASLNVLKAGDTMTGDLVLNPGNINLVTEPSTTSSGNILKNGLAFIHDFGSNNIFIGINAGNFTTTNFGQNVGIGVDALSSVTTGYVNTAIGYRSLHLNQSGTENTAMGANALFSNIDGVSNTAIGGEALANHISGDGNTAIGHSASLGNSTATRNTAVGQYALANANGGGNIALGYNAGSSIITGHDNIAIGGTGPGDESNTTRIGWVGSGQTATFIDGISGISIVGTPVVVNASGQLGVGPPSSARFKDDIRDIGEESNAILKLRPVSFRYKPELDPIGLEQYGLVAE
jgi:hypothetical protein